MIVCDYCTISIQLVFPPLYMTKFLPKFSPSKLLSPSTYDYFPNSSSFPYRFVLSSIPRCTLVLCPCPPPVTCWNGKVAGEILRLCCYPHWRSLPFFSFCLGR